MNKAVLIIVIILVAVVLGIVFLGQALAPQEEAGQNVEETGQEGVEEAPGVTEENAPESLVELFVGGAEFSFDPSSLNLKTGQRVKINFQNIGRASHNFTIEGLNIATQTIGPGQTATIELVVPAPGNYTYYCSVPGHREAGQEGTLTVVN